MSDAHEHPTPLASKRCAVYTRVSVDDAKDDGVSAKGLFNLMLELLDESYLKQLKKRMANPPKEGGP